MLKIGITGNIGSGKTIVSKILSKQINAPIFNSDYEVHKFLNNNKEIFNILKVNNKKDLANIIFNSEKERKTIENIIHPIIKKKIKTFFIKNKSKNFCICEVPLLFEVNIKNYFDIIITIISKKQIRKKRKNNLNFNKIEKIQLNEKLKIKNSNIIIKNNNNINNLKKSCKNIFLLINNY